MSFGRNVEVSGDSTLPEDFVICNEVIWPVDDSFIRKPPLIRADRCQCQPVLEGGDGSSSLCCLDVSCSNFAMQEECGSNCPAGKLCGNNAIAKKRWRPLCIRPTPNKGHGLFATSLIPANSFIIEYCGEVVGESDLNKRFFGYKGERMLYVLQLSKGIYIDARKKGGAARFINHSCDPNCTMESWKVQGGYRMCVFAIRTIAEDEELTFDYQVRRSQ